jgi:hypothetical protein
MSKEEAPDGGHGASSVPFGGNSDGESALDADALPLSIAIAGLIESTGAERLAPGTQFTLRSSFMLRVMCVLTGSVRGPLF